jgi:predicted adenylyl cyclase CyaB
MSIWEIERKYRIPSEDSAHRLMEVFRLARFRESSSVFQRDEYYETSDGVLTRADYTVRLREIGDETCMIALKGPRLMSGSTYSRIELEFSGIAADKNRLELKRAGLEPYIVIEKRRRSFSGQRTTIVIDEVARLGWFCEIEGTSEDAIDEVAARLGLLTLDEVTENYTELLRTALGLQTGGFKATFADQSDTR